jgi:phage terminase large subunit-like protein
MLCAVDTDLFAHTFFPKTFRQASAALHKRMWEPLDNPRKPFVLLASFRGSSKTTRARAFIAKRIAFGLSKTILYLGASEDHALRSVQWIRQQVEKNELYAKTFGLEPGRKWQEHEAQIFRKTENDTAWIIGAGITSQGLRGINFDDYRPDLIVIDDAITDENASTQDQREKIKNTIFGAVVPSLAPSTEAPNRKIVMLQTPINADDAAAQAMQDPMWATYSFPCWTGETLDAPANEQISAWPERFTTQELRSLKANYLAQNRLSVWMREFECRITSAEKMAFRPEWWNTWEGPDPQGSTIIVIDPVPPPSEVQIAKGLKGKDWEVHTVLRRTKGQYYVLEYRRNRGHEPNWTLATLFELAAIYKPVRIVFEAVAYQRVLDYLIRTEMSRRGIYYALVPVVDKQSKYNRILSAMTGLASQGALHFRESMVELHAEFVAYPSTTHDDILDSIAIGLINFRQPVLELDQSDYTEIDESAYETLVPAGACP